MSEILEYYGYIYKVTDLVNRNDLPNPFYTGKRVGKFNPKYYGSGKLIQRSIKKYGTEYFKVELIDYAISKDDHIMKEIYWIKENDCIWPKGYNLAPGGEGVSLVGKANGMFGKHHTDITKKFIGIVNSGENNAHYNTKWMYNKILNIEEMVTDKDITVKLNSGWVIGRSDSVKLLMKNRWKSTHKNHKKSYACKDYIWIRHTKTNETKRVTHYNFEAFFNKDWVIGRGDSPITGTKWVYHPITNVVLRVNPYDIAKYLHDGFMVGRNDEFKSQCSLRRKKRLLNV